MIYKIPRTYPGIGRIVDATVLDATGVIGGGLDTTRLRKLVDETEKPGRSPVSVTWSNFDTVRLQAATGQGESILLQETWDPALCSSPLPQANTQSSSVLKRPEKTGWGSSFRCLRSWQQPGSAGRPGPENVYARVCKFR